MAGGGVAFSQALQSQDETNTGSGEPVVRYGTGGRITGFDKGAIKELAKFGRNGDTILAHINPQEARMLKRAGGSGTINPITGLPEFVFSDDSFETISLEGGGGGGGFGGGDFGGGFGGDSFGYSDTSEQVQDWQNVGNNYSSDTNGPMAGDNSLNSDKNTYIDNNVPEMVVTDNKPTTDPLDAFLTLNNNFVDTSIEPVAPYVAPFVDDNVPEIIIPAPRPDTEPYVAPFIQLPYVEPYIEPFVDDNVPEIIIPAPRPRDPDVTIDPIVPFEPSILEPVDPYVPPEDPYVPPEDPYVPPEDPYVPPEDPYVPPEDPYIPPYIPPYVPPYVSPYVPPYVPPVVPPAEPYVPPAVRNIYRSQYQNYADPLTMFNVSNYGTDPATSAGYNYATTPGNMGIDQLNQNLRAAANQQMARTYPDGSPRGADMNSVLTYMRENGLTATDLENARYGRTTGLNTPFSQYNKTAPTAQTFGGGIAELIKSLPK